MKTSSYASNHKVEHPLSIVNKPVFKLPTTLPRRIAALQQSLTSSPTASTTTRSSSSLVSPYVLSIANTMKLRMKAAVNTMVWNGNRHNTPLSSVVSPSTATDTVTTTPLSLCDLQQQQKQQPGQHHEKVPTTPTLKNGTLLKQYLTFVQEETGVIMDMDISSDSSAYQPSFETQQDHQSHSLASSGAALIESIIHHSPSKLGSENIPGKMPTTISSAKPLTPQRRTNRPTKSTSVATALKMEEEEKRFKKSERLRVKQQQCKSRWTSLKTTMISNKSKKEYATPQDSAAAVIRCICATPHEEFGSMVQCDDCTCWLHLECLALDEDALDETFRCPSCSISLGPGQHLTSSITWRVAAQLKSQHLANRRNSTTEAAVTNNNKYNRRGTHQSYHRGSNGRRSQDNTHALHIRYRLQQRNQPYQKEKRRRRLHHPRRPLLYSAQDDSSSSSSSSSDSDDDTDKHQHHRTWMIPKMTIHSSISTTMTTSTGNVLVQKLNNRRTPWTTATQENSISNDDTDVDMDTVADSDTTESDWESNDRYQHYQHRRSSIHDDEEEDDDDYSQDDIPTSTSTRPSFSSINTTPSLTLSPSHTGSDTDSPCEASTPPDEHFGHDDTYMQVMTDNNSPTTSDAEQQLMLSTTATSACLDQESLLWLSRLAYLESLQSSTRQQCFTPHASDVFLCGDQEQQQQHQKCNPAVTMMIDQEENDINDTNDHHHYSQLPCVPLVPATARSDPPSAICSQDLSQFSFDAGPFWSPIQ